MKSCDVSKAAGYVFVFSQGKASLLGPLDKKPLDDAASVTRFQSFKKFCVMSRSEPISLCNSLLSLHLLFPYLFSISVESGLVLEFIVIFSLPLLILLLLLRFMPSEQWIKIGVG